MENNKLEKIMDEMKKKGDGAPSEEFGNVGHMDPFLWNNRNKIVKFQPADSFPDRSAAAA